MRHDLFNKKLAAQHEQSGLYSGPQLRLWAKMIQCGVHSYYTDPPRVPQITGFAVRQESLTDAISGAATAIAKIFAI